MLTGTCSVVPILAATQLSYSYTVFPPKSTVQTPCFLHSSLNTAWCCPRQAVFKTSPVEMMPPASWHYKSPLGSSVTCGLVWPAHQGSFPKLQLSPPTAEEALCAPSPSRSATNALHSQVCYPGTRPAAHHWDELRKGYCQHAVAIGKQGGSHSFLTLRPSYSPQTLPPHAVIPWLIFPGVQCRWWCLQSQLGLQASLICGSWDWQSQGSVSPLSCNWGFISNPGVIQCFEKIQCAPKLSQSKTAIVRNSQ